MAGLVTHLIWNQYTKSEHAVTFHLGVTSKHWTNGALHPCNNVL